MTAKRKNVVRNALNRTGGTAGTPPVHHDPPASVNGRQGVFGGLMGGIGSVGSAVGGRWWPSSESPEENRRKSLRQLAVANLSVSEILEKMELFTPPTPITNTTFTLHCWPGTDCRYIAYDGNDVWLCKDATCEGETASRGEPLPRDATITFTSREVKVRLPLTECWTSVHNPPIGTHTHIDATAHNSNMIVVETKKDGVVTDIRYTSESTYTPPSQTTGTTVRRVEGNLHQIGNQFVQYTFILPSPLRVSGSTFHIDFLSPPSLTDHATASTNFEIKDDLSLGSILKSLDIFPQDVLKHPTSVKLYVRADEACKYIARNGDVAQLSKAQTSASLLKGGATLTINEDEIRLSVLKDWFRRHERTANPNLAGRVITLYFDRIAPGDSMLRVTVLRGGKHAEIRYTSEGSFVPPKIDKRKDELLVERVIGIFKDVGQRVVFTTPFDGDISVGGVHFHVRLNNGQGAAYADGVPMGVPMATARNSGYNVDDWNQWAAAERMKRTAGAPPLTSAIDTVGTRARTNARLMGERLNPMRLVENAVYGTIGGDSGRQLRAVRDVQRANKTNTIAIEGRIERAHHALQDLQSSAARRGNFSCNSMPAKYQEACQAVLQYATQRGRLRIAWEPVLN